MTPLEVDHTELWKIAAFLGTDIDRTPTEGAGDRLQSGRDLAAEYRAWEAGEGPEPEARPVDLSMLPDWMREGLTGDADPPG